MRWCFEGHEPGYRMLASRDDELVPLLNLREVAGEVSLGFVGRDGRHGFGLQDVARACDPVNLVYSWAGFKRNLRRCDRFAYQPYSYSSFFVRSRHAPHPCTLTLRNVASRKHSRSWCFSGTVSSEA